MFQRISSIFCGIKMIYDTYGPTMPLWVYFKLKWCCVVRLFKKYTYMTTNNLASTIIGFFWLFPGWLNMFESYWWQWRESLVPCNFFAELIKIWSLTTKGIPLSVVVWCTFTSLHGSMLYVHLSPCKYDIHSSLSVGIYYSTIYLFPSSPLFISVP